MSAGAGQTRTASFVEAVANTAIGYAISVAATLVFLPAFGVAVSAGQATGISAAFTALSFLRSYVLRRVFEWIRRRGR